MKKIYLDNAATTPVASEVLGAMKPYFCDDFGNPSSIHSYGQVARSAVDESRQKIAKFLNCEPGEIIFTSGGSESDNLAIKGIVERIQNTEHRTRQKPHVITAQFEHHAVLDTVKELEREGKIEATYIKPDKDGLIAPADIERAIKENTVLISIMYVNNEIGTIQPIREIGKLIQRINLQRSKKQETITKQIHNSKFEIPDYGKKSFQIFFHTDAVQAPEYCDMDMKYLHVDLLTMSVHKIYGPKGIGLMFIKKGTPLKHQIIGGGQEYRLRAGTENVVGIVGFAEAVTLIKNLKLKTKNYNLKLKNLRDKLIDGLLKIPGSRLNGSREHRTPNNVNISFDNAEGESILINLDMAGSACTSGSLEPSHVLTAIGVPAEKSHGSIRFTLGRSTSEEDIDYVIKIMPGIIEKLRKMSPFQ